jgi:predicted alpha-1,2-mannosidase
VQSLRDFQILGRFAEAINDAFHLRRFIPSKLTAKFTASIAVMRFLVPLLSIVLLISCSQHNEEFAEPLNYVNPFIGTGGHGHTYPGATMPFGMVQLSPDTRLEGWDGCGGYHYSDSLIYGFSHTHLQGTGISDYGDILFMPTNSTIHQEGTNWGERYRSAFRKENEKAEAGYYSVLLDDHDMLVELTATQRVGIHRYTPQNPQDSITLFVDLEHRDNLIEYSFYELNDSILVGHRISREWAEEQHIYFAAVFSEPYHYNDQTFEYSQEIDPVSGDTTLVQEYVAVFPIVFDPCKELIIRVGLSPTGIQGAVDNLFAEAPHGNFDTYKTAAQETWKKELSKIQIKGGSEDEKTNFYTALYHSLTVPNLFCDVDGAYRGTDLKVHESPGHDYYTIFSLWDTFRATHPLYTIIERDRTSDFINTFLKMYEDGGQLPIWELSGNYTGCMIGYHSIPVIVDADAKGIGGFDRMQALEAMVQIADSVHLGKDVFAQDGFIAADKEHESVSKTLEYAYDDWCIAQFAKSLGREDIYSRFIERAQYYKNIINPQTGFCQAKRNGNWLEPFLPEEVNFNFTEANSYQYSFFVPQDISGMIEHMGGEEKFCEYLDRLFTAPLETSGREQPDITGLIGQYAHGNEPSHHMAYLYNYAGQPWKTQKYTRQIMDELYWNAPDGLSGNEDCGQMSSWYVLSAMGIYPVTPGSDLYTFGSPLFEEVVIHLENGRDFTIKAHQACEERPYIEKIRLNKSITESMYLTNEQIMAGGEIEFVMCDIPHKAFGTAKEFRPVQAISEHLITPVPVISAPRTFSEPFELTISSAHPEATVFYSVNGGEKQVYSTPVSIRQSTTIEAWAELSQHIPSKHVTSHILKIDGKRTIELRSEYANQYAAGGEGALVDQLRGGLEFQTGEWQGYWGEDLEAVVDLGDVRDINYLGLGCLQDTKPWIVYPVYVEFWTSQDGTNFASAGRFDNTVSAEDYTRQYTDMGVAVKTKARYIKVVAGNYGTLPEWHLGHGGKAWLFVDEVIVK